MDHNGHFQLDLSDSVVWQSLTKFVVLVNGLLLANLEAGRLLGLEVVGMLVSHCECKRQQSCVWLRRSSDHPKDKKKSGKRQRYVVGKPVSEESSAVEEER